MSDGVPDSTTGETFRLIYRSHNLIPEDERRAELGKLFSTARSNNKKAGITGALLLDGEWFVQALEGEEEAVTGLYDSITKDTRHDSVSVIATGTVPNRVFGKWNMARVTDDGEADITLIAHPEGIHRAHKRDTTPEQDDLLAVMRSEVRNGSDSPS